MPADDIALVFRSLQDYRRPLLDLAGEMGVPLAVGGDEPVGARPSVQALLNLPRLVAGDFAQAEVLTVLKSSLVDFAALQPAEGLTPEMVEEVACEAMIIGGRETWARQLERYGQRLQRQRERAGQGEREDEEGNRIPPPAALEEAQKLREVVATLFDRLVALLDPLDRDQSRQQHTAALLDLAGKLGIRPRLLSGGPCAEMAANLVAYDGFVAALTELAAAEGRLAQPEGIALAQFTEEAERLAADTMYELRVQRQGRVQAVDIGRARQLRRGLFVCGLTEGQWPLAQVRGPSSTTMSAPTQRAGRRTGHRR